MSADKPNGLSFGSSPFWVLLISFTGAAVRGWMHYKKLWESEHPIAEPIFWFFASVLLGLFVILLFVHKGETKAVANIRERAPLITLFALLSIAFLTILACLKEVPGTHELKLSLMDVATAGLLGVVGAIITLIGIQVFLFSEQMLEVEEKVDDTGAFLDKTKSVISNAESSITDVKKQIENARNDFKAEVRGTAEASIRALEAALNLKRILKPLVEASEIHHGFDALGSQYVSWANRLNRLLKKPVI